jgi:hypothetical protein
MQMNDEDAIKLFTSLNPRMQQLLFQGMRTQRSQLKAAQKELDERYTVGDMAIYFNQLNLINNPQSSVNNFGQGFDVEGWEYTESELLGCNHVT